MSGSLRPCALDESSLSIGRAKSSYIIMVVRLSWAVAGMNRWNNY